jgi:hypothetical protein
MCLCVCVVVGCRLRSTHSRQCAQFAWYIMAPTCLCARFNRRLTPSTRAHPRRHAAPRPLLPCGDSRTATAFPPPRPPSCLSMPQGGRTGSPQLPPWQGLLASRTRCACVRACVRMPVCCAMRCDAVLCCAVLGRRRGLVCGARMGAPVALRRRPAPGLEPYPSAPPRCTRGPLGLTRLTRHASAPPQPPHPHPHPHPHTHTHPHPPTHTHTSRSSTTPSSSWTA